MRKHTQITAAAVVLMVGCGAVNAQEDDYSRYGMGEIVVSATRTAGVERIGTVHTVTRARLEASGATTLDDALRLVPGLQVRTGGAGTPRIDIRGFRTRHVQLLLDGIPLNDTYDGQFDPTSIPVEHIERIKVTTGGGSLLYGPGGNGGVINIITRSGGVQPSGSLSAAVGTGGAHDGALNAAAGRGPWQAFVSGESHSQDSYPLASGSEDRDNSDRQRQYLFAGARYAPTARTRLGLTMHRLGGEHGVPPITNEDKNDPFSQKTKYDRQDDLSAYGVQLAFDHEATQRLGLRGWTYLRQQETEDNRYDDATYATQTANGARRAQATTETAGASVQIRQRVAATGMATIGLLAESHAWETDGFAVDKKGATTFDRSASVRVLSTALQYEVWPRPGLALTAGAAYAVQARDDADNAGDVSGQLGGSYQLSDRTRVKASWSRKVRFPSIRQLYDVDSGNRDLEAERTLHYELGVEHQLSAAIVVSADAFSIDAEGFIEKEGDEPFRNYEDLRLRGVELASEITPRRQMLLRGSYAYLHSEDRSPSSERDELQHRPRHALRLQATHRLGFGLTPHLAILHVADQYFYDNDKQAPLEKRSLPDHTLVDLRLGQRLAGERVMAHVGIDNLLDEDYEESYGLPQPGRRLNAGLRYAF